MQAADCDGLLGLDVLRDCTVALDAQRMVIACDPGPDMGAAAGDVSLLSKNVCFAAAGPCLQRQVNGAYRYVGDKVDAVVDRRGNIKFTSKPGSPLGMRTEGEERNWLRSATLLARYHIGQSHDLRRSFEALPRLLDWVWSQSHWPLAERHDVVFRIWDQVAEPSDPELGAAGAHARQIIDRFVQKVAPAGSRDAYGADELDALNRRREGPRCPIGRRRIATHRRNDVVSRRARLDHVAGRA